MDPSKKRKADENGTAVAGELDAATPPQPLTPGDARMMIEPLAHDQHMSILQEAVVRHPDVLAPVRAAADVDPAHRKLFIRGLGSETTTDSIRSLFSSYGELVEAVVITDKLTGKSKGFGFVTFKHVDGAVLALKQPSKKIDGRMAVAQLAAVPAGGPNTDDVAARKVYVGNIPVEISAERLLDFFSEFGEIEEGPLGFDKQVGKPKGFAFFVYRTEEGAKASLMEPVKKIDGHQVLCKLAVDKGKGYNPSAGGGVETRGERMGGMGMPSSGPGSMNPQFAGPMLSISAADLNLKLMRWRALPSLDLSILSPLKCLLLGAGTLGCEVACLLMAWGIRKITLVDNGRVSMSNPLRQSLYGFEDCLNGGEYKAVAAEKSLKCIHPAAEAKGIVMNIPMPGHSVPAHEENKVLDSCRQLHDLVDSHDVIFLLTDTRESRWLPTLLCSSSNKIAITSNLGFDSFLVMRHGAGPLSSTNEGAKALSSSMANLSVDEQIARQRLGCYFCNDVVAPVDSMSNRTLDQQCTVTRPGVAPMASSLAVELLVGILHHPLGIYAPGEVSSSNGITNSEQPLGLLPHQIHGSLYHCSQMTLIGQASECCTACNSTVVTEYRNRGTEFLLQAINHPTYLEDLTGLTELMKSASAFALDWDDATADENDDEEFVEI